MCDRCRALFYFDSHYNSIFAWPQTKMESKGAVAEKDETKNDTAMDKQTLLAVLQFLKKNNLKVGISVG